MTAQQAFARSRTQLGRDARRQLDHGAGRSRGRDHSGQPPHGRTWQGLQQRSGFQTDPYVLSRTPVVERPTRTKFDSRVEHVMERDGVPRHVAMSRARQEYPENYAAHQSTVSTDSASAQHTRRAGYGVGKSAPSFSDLCEIEIRKGCSPTLAAQRVINAHGADAPDARITKGDSALAQIEATACEILDAEGGDRVSALRKARLLNPSLYRRLA
jgi:hypothetical protein